MNDEQNAKGNPGASCEDVPFARMMEQMMGEQGQGACCADRTAKMMATCCGTEGDVKQDRPSAEGGGQCPPTKK